MKKIYIILFATSCFTQLFAQSTFQLSSGTNAKPTGGVYLVFNNMNLVNNGTMQQATGDGSIKFSGSGDESLSGSGVTTIDSLILAKGNSANLNLQSDINVVSRINFISGSLNFGNNIIELGGTGAFYNESETSRAFSAGTGHIQSGEMLNAPQSVNVGNLGAIITSSANLGRTVVTRGFTSNGSIPDGKSILRYYVITPANNTGLNATYRFEYLDEELNGAIESSLTFWKSTDNIAWTDSGFTVHDTVNNYVEKTGINDFSFWTLAAPVSVLPITLSSFNAHKNGAGIEINWKVLTSLNVTRYEIERSTTGSSFIKIGELPAMGAVNYTYMDQQPFNSDNFYRLRIIDADGSIKYSGVVKVNINSKVTLVNFFPNPVTDNTVTLQLTNAIKGNYNMQIVNTLGQRVYRAVIVHSGGSSIQTINLPQNLGSGIYRVQLKRDVFLYKGALFVK